MTPVQAERFRKLINLLDSPGEQHTALAKANEILESCNISWRDISFHLGGAGNRFEQSRSTHKDTPSQQDYGFSSAHAFSEFESYASGSRDNLSIHFSGILSQCRIRTVGAQSYMMDCNVYDQRTRQVWKNVKSTDSRLILPILARMRKGDNSPVGTLITLVAQNGTVIVSME